MPTINVIGAGRVGTALCRAISAKGGYELQNVYSRTRSSSEALIACVGRGSVAPSLSNLEPADITLIATNDGSISQIADEIVQSGIAVNGRTFFHCSGALSSSELGVLRRSGAFVSSVHPIKSFTDPVHDAESFGGTWCSVEGDEHSNRILTDVFDRLDANCFTIETSNKAMYHLAAVMACNFIFPLFEAGIECYKIAGIEADRARQIIAPIMRGTVENCLTKGAVASMTGPVSRGDLGTVRLHLDALRLSPGIHQEIYRVLSKASVNLSAQKGLASKESLDEIAEALEAFGAAADPSRGD